MTVHDRQSMPQPRAIGESAIGALEAGFIENPERFGNRVRRLMIGGKQPFRRHLSTSIRLHSLESPWRAATPDRGRIRLSLRLAACRSLMGFVGLG